MRHLARSETSWLTSASQHREGTGEPCCGTRAGRDSVPRRASIAGGCPHRENHVAAPRVDTSSSHRDKHTRAGEVFDQEAVQCTEHIDERHGPPQMRSWSQSRFGSQRELTLSRDLKHRRRAS